MLMIALCKITVFAQGGTQVEFGQNRVQYHDFDWVSHESEHFITYYYPGGQEIGKFVIIAAEDRVKQLEEKLNYILGPKIEILIYNDITDLAQTNIGIAEGRYNIGGTNETEGTKLFLYFDGNHSNLLNLLEKELAKIYLNSMMAGRNFAEVIQNAVFLNLPNWYIDGLASYFGEEWSVHHDEKLRKFWNETSKPSFSKLSQIDPEFAGHALWYYIYEQYGNTGVKNILYLTRINRSINKGFQFAIGKTYNDVIAEWNTYQSFHSKNDLVGRESLSQDQKIKTKLRKNQLISQVKISPDARNIAYTVHKFGQYKVYVQAVDSKKRKRILKGGFNSDNYPYDHSYPIIAWHPASTTVTAIHERQDKIQQIDWDILNNKKYKNDIRGFQRIFQANYTPDGRSLILSAQNRGQSDIYTYHLTNRAPSQLTNDIFDDSHPIMVEINGTRGVIYSSNKPNDKIEFATYDSILPVGKSHLYFIDLQNQPKKSFKISNETFGHQTHANRWEENHFTFLSDENGFVNLYKATLSSEFSHVDTIYQDGEIFTDSIYTYRTDILPLSDFPTNILDASVAHKVNKWAFLVQGIKKSEIYIAPISSKEYPGRLTSTNYRNSLTSIEKQANTQKRSERMTQDQIDALQNIDTLIDQEFSFYFNSKWDYTLPTSVEKAQREKDFRDSLGTHDSDIQVEIVEEKSQPIVQFRSGQAVPYRAKFSTNFLTTQIDNSVLPFSYQSVSQNGTRFDYPNLSGMITYGIQDLMEDHKLTGGFRLPTDFKGTEVFVSYENLKKRLDKRILFYRKSNQETYSLLVNNTYIIPAIGKQKTNYFETRLSYPFDITKSLRLYGGYRNDRLVVGYTDTITMRANLDENENWSFLKLEFVHDNSKEVQVNIFNGFRYKFFTEYFRNWSEKKSNLFTIGYDIRHYTSIFKTFIWANRLAGATSFGQKKVLYSLGGVDSWINNKYDNSVGVSTFVDYAFQAHVTNVRGFGINIRNGSSHMVYNTELRMPVFSLFSKKNIKSSFIKNFQLVGFFDIGSAYNGLTPFNEKNPYVTELVTPGGNQTPVVVKVDYYRNPTVMGTGFGVRSILLGYFLRLDWAWGIDGGFTSNKPMWIFSFSKDF